MNEIWRVVANHPFVVQLRYGTLKGIALKGVTRLQGVIAGSTIAAIGLAAIYIGM